MNKLSSEQRVKMILAWAFIIINVVIGITLWIVGWVGILGGEK